MKIKLGETALKTSTVEEFGIGNFKKKNAKQTNVLDVNKSNCVVNTCFINNRNLTIE